MLWFLAAVGVLATMYFVAWIARVAWLVVQRHGIAATFVDPFSREPLAIGDWLDAVRRLVSPDAAALGCGDALAHLDTILARGTSADRQIGIYRAARDAGRQRLTAVKEVIDWAAAATRGLAD